MIDSSVLIVSATAAEAAYVPQGLELLITGVATVPATIALARRLASGPQPRRVINIGTAGALRPGMNGVYEIDAVLKHDFDTDTIEQLTGGFHRNAMELERIAPELPAAALATGDAFIADAATRDALARRADLVDMEGWAIAYTAREFGIPVTLLKQVSDNADEDTAPNWNDVVDRGAQELADVIRSLRGHRA